MRTKLLPRVALATFIGLFIIALSGCAPKDDGSIPVTTKSKKAEEFYQKGLELTEKLQGADAKEFFEKAVAEDPNFALAWLNLALVQPTYAAYYETAAKASALISQVSEGEALMIKAADAAAAGKINEMLSLYQQLAEKYPKDKRAHNLLGNTYFSQQQYGQAVEEYKKALAIDSTFSQPYNQLGYCYRFQGQYVEAEEAFKKYTNLIPNDPNPYDSQAELQMKMGKYEESIQQYEKALSLNPNFVASYIGIASNLNYLGRFTDARAKLQELLDRARNTGEKRSALYAMAVSLAHEGNYAAALEKIERMKALAEEAGDTTSISIDLNTMGIILLEKGQADSASVRFAQSLAIYEVSSLDEALKADARNGNLFNLARVASAKGEIEKAQALSDSFRVKVEPLDQQFKNFQAHELKGLIALGAKDYAKATEELLRANQQNPYILYSLALAYQGLGDKETAGSFCAKLFNFNALNNLNYAFVKTKAQQLLASLK